MHNAPAGYWSIATRSQAPSTSLCCHDASFAAGLLDAATQVAVDGKPVALITYDQPYPEPLHAVRPFNASFGLALVLTAQATDHALAALDVSYVAQESSATNMTDSGLDDVRASVPAARCLPLLAALARATSAVVILAYGVHHLRVEVTPWS